MKRFWRRLGPALKTTLVGIASTAAGAALDAIITGLSSGTVRRPSELLKTGGIAALVGLRAYWMRKPTDPPPIR